MVTTGIVQAQFHMVLLAFSNYCSIPPLRCLLERLHIHCFLIFLETFSIHGHAVYNR